MRKLIALLVIIVLAVSFVSCGNDRISMKDRENFQYFAEIQTGNSPSEIETIEIFGVCKIDDGYRLYDEAMNTMDIHSNINFYKVDVKTNEKTYISYEELIVG